MAYKNRFWSTLAPSNNLAFVAKAVEYTTDNTFEDFIANAVEGEIGLYNAATNILVDPDADPAETIVAGQEYFFAQKRDGLIEVSPNFKTTDTLKRQAYVAPVKQVITATTTGTTIAIGDVLEVLVLDKTTPGMPYPSRRYNHICKSTTLNTEIDLLVALINNPKTMANKGGEDLVVAARSSSNITFTAKYFGQMFDIVLGGKFEGKTVATTTAVNFGSGSPDQVKVYEEQSDIVKGAKHAYTTSSPTALPAQYGLQTSFVDPAGTYNCYFITRTRTEPSPTPKQEHTYTDSFYVFVPTGGTNPEAEIKAALVL